MKKPLYMDYQATTPMDERVLDAMMPYLRGEYGNPHSNTHAYGWRANAVLDIAREQVADVINAEPEEIIFTSGATEANNMVIRGVVERLAPKRNQVITVCTEHKCVLESAKCTHKSGASPIFLPVKPDGLVDCDLLEGAIGSHTAIVSVMAVNNEIGVVQDLAGVGDIARSAGAPFHSDAAQAFGKIDIDVKSLPIDYVSLSAHKIYGPKGIGALWIRKGAPLPVAFLQGGGQENGLRSGTQPPALVAGFGKAAEIAKHQMSSDSEKLKTIFDAFWLKIKEALPTTLLNGNKEQRFFGNLNLSFPGVDGNRLLADLHMLALSSGAACASAEDGPSYVLEALGRTETEMQGSIRLGFGRDLSVADALNAADEIIKAVQAQGIEGLNNVR